MSIVMKEAFRYHNFLDSMIAAADNYLRYASNYMEIIEVHHRSAVVASATDENKSNIPDRMISVRPEVLIAFVCALLEEKEALGKAIAKAKTEHCPEFDSYVSLNRSRHIVVEAFKRMLRCKEKTVKSRATGYTFNSAGDQTAYSYDVEQISRYDFDKQKLKKRTNLISADADSASTTIDYWQSSVPVNFSPIFDVNDSFEDLVEEYAADVAS